MSRADNHDSASSGIRFGTVVVTGACGFIGSHLTRELLRLGAHVIGVDPKGPGATGMLQGLTDEPRFCLLAAKATAPEVAARLGGASAVVHLAAATDVAASWGAGFSDHAASVLETQRLLDACAQAGVPRMVVASSCHVYGPAGGGTVNEDAPTEPTSPYGVAKLASERLALAYARRPGSSLSAVVLRFFTAFGPGCRPAMVIRRMFDAARSGVQMPLYGDGTATHTWTYVSDLVDAAIRAVAVGLEPGCGEVFNAAGPDEASLLEVAAMVEDITGRPVPLSPAGLRPGDAAGSRADLTRARQVLGFAPAVGLRDGLLRYWEHMPAMVPAEEPAAR